MIEKNNSYNVICNKYVIQNVVIIKKNWATNPDESTNLSRKERTYQLNRGPSGQLIQKNPKNVGQPQKSRAYFQKVIRFQGFLTPQNMINVN